MFQKGKKANKRYPSLRNRNIFLDLTVSSDKYRENKIKTFKSRKVSPFNIWSTSGPRYLTPTAWSFPRRGDSVSGE